MNRVVQRAEGAGGILTIDLGRLQENYAQIAKLAPNGDCAAVVKADAYGLGLERVAQALANVGCSVFFVALANEAVRLRAVLPDAIIYVLDGLAPGSAPLLMQTNAMPVLGSLAEINEWVAFSNEQGQKLPAAVHIDTGMNRLGLAMDELTSLKTTPGLLEQLNVSLIITHLACADTPDHDMNPQQLARFKGAARLLPRAPLSAANSAGVLNGPDYHFDVVRPGIALYGGNPRPGMPNPMVPVVRLEGRILQTRTIAAGETIGYGAQFTAAMAMRIAVLSLGYGDGIFRRLGGQDGADQGEVYVAGRHVPIIGRISMDLIAIDVTQVPERQAARGTLVELLGDNITIDDVAEKAQTIGYEILTNLSRRYQRVYLGG